MVHPIPLRPAPSRAWPHNIDMEASLLGAVIINSDTLTHLAEVETDDFFHMPHKVIWQAMRNLVEAQKPIDVVTLEYEIEGQGKLESVGGIAYLGELAMRVPTADNVVAYRDTVRMLSRNRKCIVELESAAARAWTYQHDPAELIADVAGRLNRIDLLGAAPAKRLKLISVGESLEELAKLAKCPRYSTPFPTLNDAVGFGGFIGTQVYTVCGGTGRGKTSWVAAIAAHVAQTVPVLVVSYEMKPGYFIARRAAGVLGVHSNQILSGEIDMGRVLRAVPDARLILMHKPTLAELREAVEYLAAKHGTPPLVIVDYIQKLADELAAKMARPDLRQATTQASSTLLDIAEKTGAAVLAVSAIGRGKSKLLSNPRTAEPYELVEVAKESGAVEYDGAGLIVLCLHKGKDSNGERIATMTCAKTRFGEECHIEARFNGGRGEWTDLGRAEVEEPASKSGISKSGKPTPPNDDVVAQGIIAGLKKYGPQKSKTSVWKVSGKAKSAVLSELDVMVAEGRVVLSNVLGFALPEHVAALNMEPVQTAIGSAVPEAKP